MKNMKEKIKNKNGITLIALTITIIVLLILAGVALATLTGEGSIIGNAEISSSTGGELKTMELSDIQTSSSSWGNFYNSKGDAATNSGSKQNTGASEYWKSNNIYDLAGNVYEWTQEKYSTGTDSIGRGDEYIYEGGYNPAANRYNHGDESITNYYGSRFSY